MEEPQTIKQSPPPTSFDPITSELVPSQTITPPTLQPRQVPVLIWIFIGLLIAVIIIAAGYYLWKNQSTQTDTIVYVTAPTKETPTPSPSPTVLPDGTTIYVEPKILLDPKPYRNELAKFEINFPQGWQVDDSGNSGAVVIFVDPQTTVSSGSAILSFINVSTGMASGETLSGYIISARDMLQKTYPSYNLIEDKELLISGNTYHLLTGTYEIHGLTIKNRNLLLVFDHRGYSISATAPQSVWQKNEMLINASLFSFKNI